MTENEIKFAEYSIRMINEVIRAMEKPSKPLIERNIPSSSELQDDLL